MHISRKEEARRIHVDETTIAYEYPLMSETLHGALIEIDGRYPKTRRVVNEKCAELIFVVKGSGTLIVEEEEISFTEGDQLFIGPQEKYYWIANAVLFMPCTPAWYPEQHKDVD